MPSPIFFHEIPLQIHLRGKFQTIHFATGFSKPVDALSGMTVNLTTVQGWLYQLSSQVALNTFADPIQFLEWAQARLQKDALADTAELIQLQIRFFDQTCLQLRASHFYLQKSENCLIGESELSFDNIKNLKIFFQISDLAAFDRAVLFVIPKQLLLTNQNLLSELQSQAKVPIQQLEILDSILKFSEVILAQT